MNALKDFIYICGLVLYLPLLFGVAMSFDSPRSGEHWAHWAFVIGTLTLGPFCLWGLISKRFWYVGIVGFAVAALSWLPLVLVCSGKFTCQ